jgi:hypothetical protein
VNRRTSGPLAALTEAKATSASLVDPSSEYASARERTAEAWHRQNTVGTSPTTIDEQSGRAAQNFPFGPAADRRSRPKIGVPIGARRAVIWRSAHWRPPRSLIRFQPTMTGLQGRSRRGSLPSTMAVLPGSLDAVQVRPP